MTNSTMSSIARVNGADHSEPLAPPAAEAPHALTIIPDPAQGHRQVGTLSADALTQSINATADDVLAAGRAVTDVAAQITREAEELSSGIRRCGAAFAVHVTEFARLAQTVSDTMRSTRMHVLGTPEPVQPAAQRAP
jgi:hypothetical protein